MSNTAPSTHLQTDAGRTSGGHVLGKGFCVLTLLAFAVPAIAEHGSLGHPGPTSSEQQGGFSPSLSGDGSIVDSLGGGLGSANDDPLGGFLDPDLAFVPMLEVKDTRTIIARWEIADDYYLYRERFHFRVIEPTDTALGEPAFAPGKVKEDEFFGRVEVYYRRLEVTLPVKRGASVETDLTLELGYQGCADAGLCYPPMTKTFMVSLPAASETENASVGSR